MVPRLKGGPTAALAVVLIDLRYWLYELTGGAVWEVPMEVSVNGGAGAPTALRTHRTDCSAPRPQLYGYIPFRVVMERVSEGRT